MVYAIDNGRPDMTVADLMKAIEGNASKMTSSLDVAWKANEAMELDIKRLQIMLASVTCDECGTDLSTKIDGTKLTIVPCDECMSDAHDEGYGEGVDYGRQN
jgi:hypothetical protein